MRLATYQPPENKYQFLAPIASLKLDIAAKQSSRICTSGTLSLPKTINTLLH